MIKCHLSEMMGRKKLKISDVARLTELNRNTITLLYKEEAVKVDLEALNRLCTLFNCSTNELLEFIPDGVGTDG